MEKSEVITLSDIIETVTIEICDKYCKYPGEYGEEGFDQLIDEQCSNCPLNHLK